MKVSIIIPVKEINDYIREAIPYYKMMEFRDFEILIFPDHSTDEVLDGVTIIPSGEVGPAEKRDLCMKYGKGEIFAFIDDDAYPRSDWLTKALKHFEDETIGAVGGPAVTPETDSIMQKASGKVYESPLCSGKYTYRYIPEKKQDVDDLPSVNLIVRREIFEEIGGYDSNFYPGEDTKLCLDIIEKTQKRIVYDPDILVYHHRRRMFKEHLKQITNYAKHRGYFAKALPKTSCKVAYFVPSLFVIGLIMGPLLSLLISELWYVYGVILFIYCILLIVKIKDTHSFSLWALSALGIFLTHIGYGIFFIKGLVSKELLR